MRKVITSMSLLKYITISALEYLSLFIFILVQFRFSIKENIAQIGFISLLLSFVSYSFVNADLNVVFPVIQFIFVLLYIHLVMKVSIFNSMIMFFTGYIVFGLAQTCIVAAARHLDLVDGQMQAGTDEAYVIQLITIILMLIFSTIIVIMKGGFSFIEARSRFSRKTFTGKNRIFIGFIVIAFVVTMVSNVVILENKNPPNLEIASILLVMLLLLFYLSLRRDEVND